MAEVIQETKSASRNAQAAELEELLRCPICGSDLRAEDGAAASTHHATLPLSEAKGRNTQHAALVCTNTACGTRFPVVRGVPVLINEARSVFAISDFTQERRTTGQEAGGVIRFMLSHLPAISHNLVAKRNYTQFVRLLRRQSPHPRVLVVGGGAVGEGMNGLLDLPDIELVETDVYFGERTRLICDAHDLPFADDSFDAVIVQAVLEHVADPFRCVSEMWRVLKPRGLVYAETPFMQQVHLGPYDFMRFTHLGHRKLFSWFEEIKSGALAGPGSVLAWSCEYFMLSFSAARTARIVIRGFARLSLFWLKYLDYFLLDKPGTYDNASGHFFLGRKSDQPISDRELIAGYRGAIS